MSKHAGGGSTFIYDDDFEPIKSVTIRAYQGDSQREATVLLTIEGEGWEYETRIPPEWATEIGEALTRHSMELTEASA